MSIGGQETLAIAAEAQPELNRFRPTVVVVEARRSPAPEGLRMARAGLIGRPVKVERLTERAVARGVRTRAVHNVELGEAREPATGIAAVGIAATSARFNLSWRLSWTAGFRFMAALLLSAVVMQLVSLLLVIPQGPWDDAYMFFRYANNLLQHGAIAWNPGDAPTYGLTSLLFLGVVVPVRLLFGLNPYAVATASSLVCGIIFVVLLTVLVQRYAGISQFERRVALLTVYLALAASAVPLAIHSLSGMDTTFAMAYLSAYILLAKRHERTPTTGTTISLGLLGGVAFSVRPDLLLYSLAVPAGMFVIGPDRRGRHAALIMAAITSAVAGLQAGGAAVYFGTPVPLPFYAKALSQYGEFYRDRYNGFAGRMLQEYISSYWFLMCIGLGAIVPARYVSKFRTSGVNLGLALATGLFIAFYANFALQIMGMFERFYYPTLPAIAFLGAVGAARLARSCLQYLERTNLRRQLVVPVFCVAVVQALLCVSAALPAGGFAGVKRALAYGTLGNLNTAHQYAALQSTYWFRLDRFSALPDDLVIATTEVGIPCALNPGKRIIDIAGLNDTRFALGGFSTGSLLEQDRPDLIYMPHPDYHDLITQIRSDSQFVNEYSYFTSAELGGARMDIAIWRGSQYYASMRDIIMGSD